MPLCPRDQLESIGKKISGLIKGQTNEPQEKVIGLMCDKRFVNFWEAKDQKICKQGALTYLPRDQNTGNMVSYSLQIALSDLSAIKDDPITLCLLNDNFKRACNVYLESANGHKKTPCIGSITQDQPILKIPYPLPGLGTFGNFKLVVRQEDIKKPNSMVGVIQDLAKQQTANIGSCMVLNPYIHNGSVNNRLQFIDVEYNRTTTCGDIFAKNRYEIELTQTKQFWWIWVRVISKQS
eukprot:UN33901